MGHDPGSVADAGSDIILTEFFARRWRGEVALAVLFWRDMIVVGSAINLAASLLALILAAQGVALGIAVAIHFAPLPYNAFLFAAVDRSRQRTATITAFAAFWFVLAMLI